MCSAYSLPYFPETWHRLVPLPFSYMQMSIIEVAETGELCTSAGGWCLPQQRASQWSINLHHQLASFTLTSQRVWSAPFSSQLLEKYNLLNYRYKGFSVLLLLFLWCTHTVSFSLSFVLSRVTWRRGYMGHVCVSSSLFVMGGSSSSHPDLCSLLCY